MLIKFSFLEIPNFRSYFVLQVMIIVKIIICYVFYVKTDFSLQKNIYLCMWMKCLKNVFYGFYEQQAHHTRLFGSTFG
jgi:hypothetical protein